MFESIEDDFPALFIRQRDLYLAFNNKIEGRALLTLIEDNSAFGYRLLRAARCYDLQVLFFKTGEERPCFTPFKNIFSAGSPKVLPAEYAYILHQGLYDFYFENSNMLPVRVLSRFIALRYEEGPSAQFGKNTRLNSRQIDFKCRSPAQEAGHCDYPVVLSHNSINYGKPQARSPFRPFCCEKRVEYPVSYLVRYACSRIRYLRQTYFPEDSKG